MLDARVDIKSPHQPGLGYDSVGADDRDGVGGNPWGDTDADAGSGTTTTSTSSSPSCDLDPMSITPTTPRGPAYQGFGFGYTNGSTTASSTTTSLSMRSSPAHSVKSDFSGSGLWSRKASASHSQHRRVSSLNGKGSPFRSGSGSGSNSGSRSGSGSVSAHPLSSTSALAPTSSTRKIASSSLTMLDGTITRPALKRRLGSECEFYYDDSERGSSESDLWVNVNCDGGRETVRGEAEIMVIVHEVTRTDSIAGIALKYGISLADLRRANHLWASDSIHLRKVLYIPLHLSSRKDLYFPSNKDDEVDVDGASRAESSSTAQSRSSVVLQRVPMSQLAFFPPPSSSSFQPSLSPDSERKRRAHGALPNPFQGTGPNPSPGPGPRRVQSESEGSDTTGLSALLQALPFPFPLPLAGAKTSAKTRRELFSLPFPRFSGDSSESSTNVSETSSELGDRQEHEMDVLGGGTGADAGAGAGTGTSRRSPDPSRNRSRSKNRSWGRDRGRGRGRTRTFSDPHNDERGRRDRGMGRRQGEERYHRDSTASIETLKKAGYGPMEGEEEEEEEGYVSLVPLQTEQLKPSPMMQLPRSLRRDGG